MKLFAGKTYVCRNGEKVTLENDTLDGVAVFSCGKRGYLYGVEDNDDAPCVISSDYPHKWDIICELVE